MLYMDLDLLNELLNDLSFLIKSSIQLYDKDFEGTYACTKPGNIFCSFVKCYKADCCFKSDTTAMARASTGDEDCFSYPCHFGLREMLFRLTHDNIVYGYILVGPFRSDEDEDTVMAHIHEYCTLYNTDERKMRSEYYQIARYSDEKYHSIKSLVYTIFEYALNKNILSLKKNVFDTTIAPYIKKHLQDKLDMPSLCNVFSLSEKQLYTAIVKATGLSPKKYITQQRIATAKKLLITTDDPLTSIAEQVGIADYNYFCKTFKSTMGHSPAYFRRNK